MTTITKSFTGYIFSSYRHMLVSFEGFEFETILFFTMDWKKFVLILKVILSDSHSANFFKLVQVLFDRSILGSKSPCSRYAIARFAKSKDPFIC